MSIIAYLIALFATAGWGFLAATGVRAVISIAGQHAPGYPNSGQIILFVGLPIVVTIALIGLTTFFALKKKAAVALTLFAATSLICVWPFITLYAGGV